MSPSAAMSIVEDSEMSLLFHSGGSGRAQVKVIDPFFEVQNFHFKVKLKSSKPAVVLNSLLNSISALIMTDFFFEVSFFGF